MNEIYRVSWYLHIREPAPARLQRFERFFKTRDEAKLFVEKHEAARKVLGLIHDGKAELQAVLLNQEEI